MTAEERLITARKVFNQYKGGYDAATVGDWLCPSCLGTCQCMPCVKEQEKKAQWLKGTTSGRHTALR